MQTPGHRETADPRLDVHNSTVDREAAEANLCGMTDLRNGRICTKAALHAGGCEFRPLSEVARSMDE